MNAISLRWKLKYSVSVSSIPEEMAQQKYKALYSGLPDFLSRGGWRPSYMEFQQWNIPTPCLQSDRFLSSSPPLFKTWRRTSRSNVRVGEVIECVGKRGNMEWKESISHLSPSSPYVLPTLPRGFKLPPKPIPTLHTFLSIKLKLHYTLWTIHLPSCNPSSNAKPNPAEPNTYIYYKAGISSSRSISKPKL